MTRLAADIALLERAAAIAGKAIWPEGDGTSVPDATLLALEEELSDARLAGSHYRLINDEAAFLMKAARHVVMERLDDNKLLAERWTRIAELLRAAVALDLENAKKSLGEVP